MGKLLIIKGADFSVNAVDHTTGTPVVLTYAWQISDNQFNGVGGSTSAAGAQYAGYCAQDQTPIRGKYVHGIRLNVDTIGSVNVYKYNGIISAGTTISGSNLTLLEQLTTSTTGIQDLTFTNSEGYYFGNNETLVIGDTNMSLKFKFWGSSNTPPVEQHFFNYIKSGGTASDGSYSVINIDAIISD